jgi:hypothetical protein
MVDRSVSVHGLATARTAAAPFLTEKYEKFSMAIIGPLLLEHKCGGLVEIPAGVD